jgi:hypothetical protein
MLTDRSRSRSATKDTTPAILLWNCATKPRQATSVEMMRFL